MTIRENLKSGESWLRGFYILLFALFYSIAEVVLWGIVLFQFGSQLFIRQPNQRLLDFTRGLNLYIYQILQYLTYRSDTRPFPFADWPNEESSETIVAEEREQAEPPTQEVAPENDSDSKDNKPAP